MPEARIEQSETLYIESASFQHFDVSSRAGTSGGGNTCRAANKSLGKKHSSALVTAMERS